MMSPEFRHDT